MIWKREEKVCLLFDFLPRGCTFVETRRINNELEIWKKSYPCFI